MIARNGFFGNMPVYVKKKDGPEMIRAVPLNMFDYYQPVPILVTI